MMFRDDEEAARLRHDTVAAAVVHAQRRRDALARKVSAARLLPRLLAALVIGGAAVAVAGASIAGSRDAVQGKGMVVKVDAGVAMPPPPLAADAPVSAVEEHCRLAEAEACARLAAREANPQRAYRLWRRACLAGHEDACLVVADRLLAEHDSETALKLVAQQCAFGHDDSCAWLRRHHVDP